MTCATCEIDASASPRKPNVSIFSRSSYSASLDVAKRSHTRAKSSRRTPWPLSWICSSLRPPPLASTEIEVAPASSEFSSISLSADAGRWMTSPAAMRLTVCWSSFFIFVGGAEAAIGSALRVSPGAADSAGRQPATLTGFRTRVQGGAAQRMRRALGGWGWRS